MASPTFLYDQLPPDGREIYCRTKLFLANPSHSSPFLPALETDEISVCCLFDANHLALLLSVIIITH